MYFVTNCENHDPQICTFHVSDMECFLPHSCEIDCVSVWYGLFMWYGLVVLCMLCECQSIVYSNISVSITVRVCMCVRHASCMSNIHVCAQYEESFKGSMNPIWSIGVHFYQVTTYYYLLFLYTSMVKISCSHIMHIENG